MASKNILDQRIVSLSDSDHLYFRDLVEGGTLITGGLGSGKSSTSARALAMGFMRAGMGGLILTVKSDETQHFVDYAKACGREKDLIIFNAESGLVFDWLDYTWNQPGRGAHYLETVVETFTTLSSVGKQHHGSSGERYFEQAVEELMRAAITLLYLGGEKLSIHSIHGVIASLATSPEEFASQGWQTDSACGKLLTKLTEIEGRLSPSQQLDLETAATFVKKWTHLDPRTSGNIESTWSGMASKFLYEPFRRIFSSGGYSFTPEQITHERKLVVIDMPVLEVGRQASRLCQILVKIVCARSWLRHQYTPGCCNGAFLFQDEFALLMHRDEGHFHQVCRGSAIAPVCITPNIMNIAAEDFGEERPGSKTLGFLGNLSVKIFHNQTDVETCNYAADQIGKQYRYLSAYNAGTGHQDHIRAGVSGSLQLAHILEPVELTRLRKPDSANPYAEAIVYQSGKVFEASKTAQNPKGSNYLRVLFSRDL